VTVLAFDKDNYPALKGVDIPDAVYPNNHFSTWDTGDITIYHMRTEEREREKQTHRYIFDLLKSAGFKVGNFINMDRGTFIA
jgi:hypothetical protein